MEEGKESARLAFPSWDTGYKVRSSTVNSGKRAISLGLGLSMTYRMLIL